MKDLSQEPSQSSPAEITAIYARLNPQDVEQFYSSYQLWSIQQQIARLQADIANIQQQIAENHEGMQQVQPAAIALVTLAHLQTKGVSDIDLLERMLARGEDWLDQTMQQLSYCEEIDVIRGNYTEWCEHALEGAFNWINSMQHADVPASASATLPVEETAADVHEIPPLDEATEEILLQKLMSNEPEDDEESLLATTLKRPIVSADNGDILPETNPYPDLLNTPSEQVLDVETLVDIPTSPMPHVAKTKPARKPGLLRVLYLFFFGKRR